MTDANLKISLWCLLAMSLVAGCASSDKTDGLEEEVSANASSINDNLDLENLDIPGEPASGTKENFNMPRPDKEVLNPEIDPSILLAPSDAAIAKASKEMAKADAARAEELAAANGGGEEGFGSFSDAGGSRPKRVGGGGYRVPKIPGAALQKKGALLNRFYFVRNGDTPEAVGTLLYGDAARGKDLVKWNGGGWKAGKLLYYASPTQPEEHEMRSFYQERNVPPEEYLIQQGDSLFKVAKAKYGNQGSWKEVAVINGFNKVEKVEPGTRIVLYPTDLKPYAASASANGYRRNAVPPPTPSPSQRGDGGAGDLTPSAQESVPPVTSKGKKGGGFNLNFGSIIEQNLFAIVLGGGIFILLILLMALSKQRKKKSLPGLDDFNEGVTPPKKTKRK